MNPWYAKTVILLASVAMVVIRAPHGHRSRSVPVLRSRKGGLEVVLLTTAWLSFFLALIWIATPALAFFLLRVLKATLIALQYKHKAEQGRFAQD